MTGVRMVAIATHSPSHLDFGGNGFIRLMGVLRAHGHDVQWVSCGRTVGRLTAMGWRARETPELKAARPGDPLAKIPTLEDACRRLATILSDLQPQILIIDRVNTLCSAVAQELDLPFVAVGTPGGYWKFAEGGIVRTATSPRAFVELSELLKTRLGWRRASVHSAWLRSDHLNVTFMGRSFYGESGEPPSRTAHVNLHDRGAGATIERRSLGIVLGNRGRLARMRLAIERLIDTGHLSRNDPIDLLAGGREGAQQLRGLQALLAPYQVTTHGWVDYGQMYARMQRVISFGGMGAVWHALNHRLPMLLVDGGVGDQRFNCLAIDRIGVGEVLIQDADGSALGEAYARLTDTGRYAAALDAACAPDNYSDSLESVAERVVDLARG